jgi:hypothetical protein
MDKRKKLNQGTKIGRKGTVRLNQMLLNKTSISQKVKPSIHYRYTLPHPTNPKLFTNAYALSSSPISTAPSHLCGASYVPSLGGGGVATFAYPCAGLLLGGYPAIGLTTPVTGLLYSGDGP